MIPVPESARRALAAAFGTTDDCLQPFGGGREGSDGMVYAYPYGGGRRLLKIMALPSMDGDKPLFTFQERLHFMGFLGERGARIACPQPSPQGRLYESYTDAAHTWVAYSMDIAPGSALTGDEWRPGLFRNWGQMVGMLHRLARAYESWEASVHPLSGERCLTWEQEWRSFREWCPDDAVGARWDGIGADLARLPVTREAFGFTHNDPHIWNLCVDGDAVTLLDFDVANHHWFVNDIAIACQSVLFNLSGGMAAPLHSRDKLHAFLGLFLEGYGREHHLSDTWLNHLDLFIAYRRILLFIAMHGWIASQPDLCTTWRAMILSQPEIVGQLQR